MFQGPPAEGYEGKRAREEGEKERVEPRRFAGNIDPKVTPHFVGREKRRVCGLQKGEARGEGLKKLQRRYRVSAKRFGAAQRISKGCACSSPKSSPFLEFPEGKEEAGEARGDDPGDEKS